MKTIKPSLIALTLFSLFFLGACTQSTTENNISPTQTSDTPKSSEVAKTSPETINTPKTDEIVDNSTEINETSKKDEIVDASTESTKKEEKEEHNDDDGHSHESGENHSHGSEEAQEIQQGDYHLEFVADKEDNGTHLDVSLHKGSEDVLTNANVNAQIQFPDGKQQELELKYNEQEKHYTGILTGLISGQYQVKITANVDSEKISGRFQFNH